MSEFLGVPAESLTPVIPLAGLIGLYFTLDSIAGDEKVVSQDYRSLMRQALDERQEATEIAARDWRLVGDPNSDLTVGDFARRFWRRLTEIAEAERDIHRAMRWYRRTRRVARYVILLGALLSIGGIFWASGRRFMIAAGVGTFALALILAFLTQDLGNRIDAFGDNAIFRAGR